MIYSIISVTHLKPVIKSDENSFQRFRSQLKHSLSVIVNEASEFKIKHLLH